MQVEASNHRELLRSKAVVMSVTEKARQRPCQVSAMETNTSESLMKCRKRRNVIKTKRESLTWDESGGCLLIGQMVTGIKAA